MMRTFVAHFEGAASVEVFAPTIQAAYAEARKIAERNGAAVRGVEEVKA